MTTYNKAKSRHFRGFELLVATECMYILLRNLKSVKNDKILCSTCMIQVKGGGMFIFISSKIQIWSC